MANSTQSVVSDGTLEVLDISIDYLTRSEISVFFDNILTTDWTWVGVTDKQIIFDPIVPDGVAVLVKRTTDISKLRHEFSLGAAFTAKSMDEDLKQVLHIAQEASEANFAGDFFVDINMHGNRITELADGVDPQDAATIGQLSGYDAAAAASAAAAAQSAIDAADASRLTVGTTTTTTPGTNAAVSITGPAGAQVLDFQIPRGSPGPGVAAGGSTGQVLRKVDGTNYNTVWGSLTKADVGLGNVDNTSDANKPFVGKTSDTGAANIPAGTSAQRPAEPAFGQTRANLETASVEWWNGTSWEAVGAGASGAPGNPFVYENDQIVTAPYTLRPGKNGMSAGPITFGPSGSVTVPTGATWTVVD